MAAVSVPGVLESFRTLLQVRPALTGVPVHLVDRQEWLDTEAIVFSRVTMAGARWLGWGAGQASHATVQPLTLTGYYFGRVAGNDATADQAAWDRAGVVLGEVAQQLRDDPAMGGDLSPTTRYQPPRMESALWGVWPGTQNEVAIIRVRVDFTVIWQAIS